MNFLRSIFFTRPTSPNTMAEASNKVQQLINDNPVGTFLFSPLYRLRFLRPVGRMASSRSCPD